MGIYVLVLLFEFAGLMGFSWVGWFWCLLGLNLVWLLGCFVVMRLFVGWLWLLVFGWVITYRFWIAFLLVGLVLVGCLLGLCLLFGFDFPLS